MKAFAPMAAIVAVATLAGCASQPQGLAQAGGLGLPSAGTLAGQPSTVGTVAGQLSAVGTTPGAASTVTGMASAAGQGASLTNVLVQQLGVTPTQAVGGAGAIFSTAQQNMSPTDFAQVSKAVPGMGQYLAAAPSQAAPAAGTAGLMGTAASALGGSGGSLGTMALLAGSFQSLGMNSGMTSQFIPVVLQYVQTNGGSATMGLLQNALPH